MFCGLPSHNHPLDLRFNCNVNQRILLRLPAILSSYVSFCNLCRETRERWIGKKNLHLFVLWLIVRFEQSNQRAMMMVMIKKKNEIRQVDSHYLLSHNIYTHRRWESSKSLLEAHKGKGLNDMLRESDHRHDDIIFILKRNLFHDKGNTSTTVSYEAITPYNLTLSSRNSSTSWFTLLRVLARADKTHT